MEKTRERRVITVVLGTQMTCYRELLLGISSFGNAEGNWHIDVCGPDRDYLGLIRKTKPAGLLLGTTDRIADATQAIAEVPHCVAVCAQLDASGLQGLAQVECDDLTVGEMGARHFLSKGFVNFGFVGQHSRPWSDRRRVGFEAELIRVGASVSIYLRDFAPPAVLSGLPSPQVSGDLGDWLWRQPKPLAVLTCNDVNACDLAKLCLDLSLRVPEDVAILGVDNDDLACVLSKPHLSSVMIPWKRLGREAATLLDDMIDGRPVEHTTHTLPPTGIAERQSTDVVAISDPDVRSALRFIRDHSRVQITVEDVVHEVPIARRALERKFRALLGRTLLEEIRRVHLEQAKLLLAETDLPIKEIAAQSGFASATWFSKAFSDLMGDAPVIFRKRHRQ